MARTEKKVGISDFFIDIGKPISYFPSFRKVTGTTNSAILLCQFLFWSKVTNFGWFFKDAFDLEDETGLTYKEQKSAREILVGLGILEEKYDRIDHTMYFKINKIVLNDRWEEHGGKQTNLITKESVDKIEEKTPAVQTEFMNQENAQQDLDEFKKYMADKKKSRKPVTAQEVSTGKRGDFTTLLIDTGQSIGYKKEGLKQAIFDTVSKRLNVNPAGNRWNEFIEYAMNRHVGDKQHISKFLDWAIENGFDPIYWTPQKMITLWPQAFTEKPKATPTYVKNEPIQEKEIAPMPKELRRKSV